jgi:prepilin-type processing-associated H-X9-DG protein
MSDPIAARPHRCFPPSNRRGFTLLELIFVFLIIAGLVAFFLPSMRRGGEPAARSTCRNNLKQIGIALHSYHSDFDAFPPASTVDPNGNRLHSWRTLILPYLDQTPLYERIDLSKPWDDPANAEFLKIRLGVYACPSSDGTENHTGYIAIVSPSSCLQPTHPRKIAEITDGTSNTLMVIEVATPHEVPWMAPQDADESMFLGYAPETKLHHSGGGHALFADGSVNFISVDTSAEERRAMISVADGDNHTLSAK